MISSRSFFSKSFDIVNYSMLVVIAGLMIIPFVYIIAGSFATSRELVEKQFILFPTEFTLVSYEYIFSSKTIPISLGISVLRTVLGTLVNLLFTALMAYPLAHKEVVGRRAIMLMIIFTLIFNGGMIPTFLVVKSLNLYNSFWSMILPVAISPFYLILWKNFFQQVPRELEEAAEIDGCNDVGIFIKVVLPLSLPAFASFMIFYAVGHWNSYFDALIYISKSSMWPIQVHLRQVVLMAAGGMGDTAQVDTSILPPPLGIKMATIVISSLPILIVYPFMQKYFVQGVTMGSIKG